MQAPEVTYTTYTASLYIDGVHKAMNKGTRQDAANWLDDIMQKAHAVGLPISSPRITAIKARAGHGWSSVAFEDAGPVINQYDISNDPAILDWHPEWRE